MKRIRFFITDEFEQKEAKVAKGDPVRKRDIPAGRGAVDFAGIVIGHECEDAGRL
jgi:hypothetical protein